MDGRCNVQGSGCEVPFKCGLRNAEWTDCTRFKVQGSIHCGLRISDCGMDRLYKVQGARFHSNTDCGLQIAEWTDGAMCKVQGANAQNAKILRRYLLDADFGLWNPCRMRSAESLPLQTANRRLQIEECETHFNADCGIRNATQSREPRAQPVRAGGNREPESGPTLTITQAFLILQV